MTGAQSSALPLQPRWLEAGQAACKVYAVDAKPGRVLVCDTSKNVHGSHYHVREPETSTLNLSPTEFVGCARKWKTKLLALQVGRMAGAGGWGECGPAPSRGRVFQTHVMGACKWGTPRAIGECGGDPPRHRRARTLAHPCRQRLLQG